MGFFNIFKKDKKKQTLEKANLDDFNKEPQNTLSQEQMLNEMNPSMNQNMNNQEENYQRSYNEPSFSIQEKTRQKLDDLGFQRQEQFKPAFQENSSGKSHQEELINAKLDAIKAMMESFGQRLASIEKYLQKKW